MLKVYLVGGAVRDALLGLRPAERDWLVVGATPSQMLARGFKRLDGAFPVFKHPETGEEYALARTERKVAPGHKGFETHYGVDVTLEQDLARRDLTINAMAEAEDGTLIDPFNGREDLDMGRLRHVTPAFVEDPLRVLRTARFAARLGRWGFRVGHATNALMKQMVAGGALAELPAERVWSETERALGEPRPARFFEVLQACGALGALFPELEGVIGRPTGHATVQVELSRVIREGAEPAVHFAALAHGVESREALANLCRRLPVPARFRELALLVHDAFPSCRVAVTAGPETLMGLLEDLDALRRPVRFLRYLDVCRAVSPEAGTAGIDRLRAAHAAAQAVSGKDLVGTGLSGKALGESIRRRRVEAIGRV